MDLVKQLQQVKDMYDEKGILTIYLSTDQTSNDQQKGEWKIRLKNGLKKLDEYNNLSSIENCKTFKNVQRKALDAIKSIQLELPRGIVLVAFPNGDIYLKKLQLQVENEFHWEKKPITKQLEKIKSNYPKEGILFLQKENVYMIETSLAEVTQEYRFELEVESNDWKQYEGLAARERKASGASHRDKFDQRLDANKLRWYKQLSDEINGKIKQNSIENLYLVGEKEIVSEFQKMLNIKKVTVIQKNYANLTSKQMIDQIVAS